MNFTAKELRAEIRRLKDANKDVPIEEQDEAKRDFLRLLPRLVEEGLIPFEETEDLLMPKKGK